MKTSNKDSNIDIDFDTNKDLTFIPLSSSSKGNCLFLSYNNTKILIDVGMTCKKVKERLASIGVNLCDIDGIFVTHHHTDHIAGLDVIYRNYNIPIYATEKTWQYILRHNKIKDVKQSHINYVYTYEHIFLNDLFIKAFNVPHDACCTVGYSVFLNGKEGYKVSIATDFGCVTEEILDNLKDTNLLFLESNHDIEMLKNGKYPKDLKERVLGKRGHISNTTAGELISAIYHKDLDYIYLGHLSEDNNIPLIAYDTVCNILECNNILVNKDVCLKVADRTLISEKIKITLHK